MLLDENHLDLSDQEKALANIKHGLEHLQQEYRDAKENHEYLRRQGLAGGGDAGGAGFDEEKEVGGECSFRFGLFGHDVESVV